MGFLASFSFKEAEATTITVTRTFTALTHDGYGFLTDSNYTDMVTLDPFAEVVSDSISFLSVGQSKPFGTYYIFRGFEYFDLSILAGMNITAATLSLYVDTDYSTTDFNVTVQDGTGNRPSVPLVASDFPYAYYSGSYASRNTSEISGVGYWNLTFTDLDIIASATGDMLKFAVRSSLDMSHSAPTGNEYVYFNTAEKGSAYAPVLSVTYETEGYRYIVHGPYYENGAVANAFVNVTLAIQNMDSNSTYLNGTDGVADLLDFQVEQKGISLSWNISSSGYNYTRIIMLTDDTFEELYIFIPDEGSLTNIYYFNFVDLAGISDGFLETRITFNGTSTILERQIADTFSLKPFWMIWNHHYDVRLTCDRGTYTWTDQVATEPYTLTFAVNSGSFPITLPGSNLTILAERKNHTNIQVNYSDSESLTSWVNVVFQHKLHGNFVTDYSLNQTGQSMIVNWGGADEDSGYRINVQYLRNGTEESAFLWINQLPSDELQFEGQFDILGLFPFDSRQLVGILILFIIGTIFTYENVIIGGFTILILASFLNLIGFLAIGWTLIGVGFIIVFLAAFASAKRSSEYG